MDIQPLTCIEISQPIGKFYLAVISAKDLIALVDIFPRTLSPEGKNRVQRKLDISRRGEIAKYVADPDAVFPTPIIVSCYPFRAKVNESGNEILLGHQTSDADIEDDNYDYGKKIGEVIDGQHRLEGLKEAGDANPEILEEFKLPVVFMLGMEPEDKAYVFSIINSKQTQVTSSLIYDLYDLRSYRSPRKTCHELAQAFNTIENGPFYRGLKMLGQRQYATEFLTQGSFSSAVIRLISKNPDEDERKIKRGESLDDDPQCPLRKLFIQNQDDLIGKILHNYFSAVRDVFNEEWEVSPQNYVLRKTVGFAALIYAFSETWPEIEASKDATYDRYLIVAKGFKKHLHNYPLTSMHVASSSKGAKDLSNRLLGKIDA